MFSLLLQNEFATSIIRIVLSSLVLNLLISFMFFSSFGTTPYIILLQMGRTSWDFIVVCSFLFHISDLFLDFLLVSLVSHVLCRKVVFFVVKVNPVIGGNGLNLDAEYRSS